MTRDLRLRLKAARSACNALRRRHLRSESTSESAKSAASSGGGDEKSSFASRSSSHVLAAAPPAGHLVKLLDDLFHGHDVDSSTAIQLDNRNPAASASRPDASRSRLAVQSEKWIRASVASMDVRLCTGLRRTKFATRSSSKETMRRKPTHGSVSSETRGNLSRQGVAGAKLLGPVENLLQTCVSDVAM